MKNILIKIGKIVSSIVFVMLVLIIVFIIIYVVRINVLAGNDRLGEVKTNFYTILTQSMYPKIKAGDIIITYKNNDDVYKQGDIITYISNSNSSQGLTITHRVIEVSNVNGKYSYKTKGDNNNTADGTLVPSENVLGRYLFKIPKAGYIQQFLVTKTGWIVAIVLPCAGIIIYDVLKAFKKVGKKKLQKAKEENASRTELNKIIYSEVKKEEVINKSQETVIPVKDEIFDPDSIINNVSSDPKKFEYNETSYNYSSGVNKEVASTSENEIFDSDPINKTSEEPKEYEYNNPNYNSEENIVQKEEVDNETELL